MVINNIFNLGKIKINNARQVNTSISGTTFTNLVLSLTFSRKANKTDTYRNSTKRIVNGSCGRPIFLDYVRQEKGRE